MIHTRKLTKNFTVKKETVEAVKGVDIDVAPGELVAFLGPNGAGKSTTLRMLTTLLRPTSGTATVAGVDVSADPAGVRARIGYIGQGNGGGHSFRVIDEMMMQGRFYGMNTTDAAARAQELLKSLDLTDLAKRTVIKLSGGQRRRMDVALGLMHSPRLLFLDEPSTGMDPQNRANLWEHIMRMRAEHGTTIVLTTHYMDEADSMSERVIVIDHGRIIADDTAARLKANLAGDLLAVEVAAGRPRACAGCWGGQPPAVSAGKHARRRGQLPPPAPRRRPAGASAAQGNGRRRRSRPVPGAETAHPGRCVPGADRPQPQGRSDR